MDVNSMNLQIQNQTHNQIENQMNRTAIRLQPMELMIFPNSLIRQQPKASKQILLVDDEIFNINALHIILECTFGIKLENSEMALNG